MDRRALAVLLLALAVGPARAQAPRPAVGPSTEVTVGAPGPDTLAAAPGGTVGFGVRIEERGGASHAVGLETRQPPGWRSLLTRPQFLLGAGASTLQLVSVRVADSALAGDYPVTVVVRGSEGWETVVEKTVRVEPREGLGLDVVGAPRFVVAGEPYEALVVVTNEGNAPAEVTLSARTTQGFEVTLSSSRLVVLPGAPAEVRAVVRTARDREGADRLRVAGALASGALVEATVHVDVVPRGGRAVLSPTWPLVAALSAVTAGADMALVVGLDGTVPLDASGDRTLTLHADGLGLASESVFDRQPEGWVQLAGPTAEAFLGTGSFELSPATSASSYGLVAGTRAARGDRDLAAAVRRPLAAGLDPGLDAGASAGTRVGSWGRLSANALVATGDRRGEVATVRLEADALPAATLDAEGGLSLDGRRPIYDVRASASRGVLAVDASARSLDARQPGRVASVTARALAARLALGRRAALWASWQRSAVGASRQAPVGTSASGAVEAGLRWSDAFGGLVARAEARAERRSVAQGGPPRTLTLGHLTTGLAWRWLRVAAEGGAGRIEALGAARPAWTGGGSLSASTHGLGLSAHTTVADGPSVWSLLPARQWTSGLTGALRLGGISLQGSLLAGRYAVETPGLDAPVRSASTMARLEATLPLGDRQLVVASYHTWGEAYAATHLSATLRVPVGLPLPYPVARPRVRGRFVDVETGAGLAGVLVVFGAARVVTDGHGAFAFDSAADGGYLLADRASLGLDRVPLTPLPLRVRPGEPVVVEVGRRARLHGALRRVTVLGTGAASDTTDADGVAFAVVEAEGVGQRYRAVTDAEGRFSFDDLAAGTYTLRLVRASLPEHHRLEHETRTVAVDDDAEVTWRVVPERREIRILGGGRLGGSSGSDG